MVSDSLIFTAKRVAQATDGAMLAGDPDTVFHGITTDSRQVSEGNLFVALRGDKFDGHDFVLMARKRGAVGILVHDETKIKSTEEYKGVTVIIKGAGRSGAGLPEVLCRSGDRADRFVGKDNHERNDGGDYRPGEKHFNNRG
jgi:UDP-N-acetylmuramyl pentapeptide synthase